VTLVFVAYATKMGGTRDIATAIGEQLKTAGMQVTVCDAHDVRTLDGYDAAVIGSALYTGRWRPEAVALLADHAEHGKAMPVWLFHSGPCGKHAADEVPAPKRVQHLADAVGAAKPITFGGRLEPATARGFIARRMATGPMAGDFRDFDRIRRWADTITSQLAVPTPIGTPHPAGDH
jgi:menaquinone-dependent protoporphyrinogen oxidase